MVEAIRASEYGKKTKMEHDNRRAIIVITETFVKTIILVMR